MVVEGYAKTIDLGGKSCHRRGTANGDLLAVWHTGPTLAGSRQAYGIGARLGKGDRGILRCGRTAIAKRPAPLSGPAHTLVGKGYTEPIGLGIKIGYRGGAVDGNITANDGGIATDTGGHQTNRISARLRIGDGRILLDRRTPVAKNPAPLGGPAGAHILKVDRKSINLGTEIAGRYRAIDGYLLAEWNAGSADAEARQANRISTGLAIADRGVLLG